VIIKKWCNLCLSVLVVLILEFGVHLAIGTNISFTLMNFVATFVGFSLPIIFWLSVRQRFLDSFKLPTVERDLNRFLKSEHVFQKLLESQACIDFTLSPHDIQIGNSEMDFNVLVVSNPHCRPCGQAHAVLTDLIEKFEGQLNVIFRFLINPNDRESESYLMLRHLFALRSKYSSDIVLKALSAWYRNDGRSNFEKWKEDFPVSHKIDDDVSNMVVNQAIWAINQAIKATPTIFINKKKLPDGFSVIDLTYHISRQLNNSYSVGK
jgi:Thioredoxin